MAYFNVPTLIITLNVDGLNKTVKIKDYWIGKRNIERKSSSNIKI